MQIDYGEPFCCVVFNQPSRYCLSLVSGVIQNLNVEFVQRVIQAANRIQQPLHHKLLVVDR